jgi:hypothetical protein
LYVQMGSIGLYRSLSTAEMKDIVSIAVDAEECLKQLLNKPPPEVSSEDATVIVAFVQKPVPISNRRMLFLINYPR